MMIQSTIVALLVFACGVYALWTLMPAVARRALALRMLALPLPTPFTRSLQKATRSSGGCGGCDSCAGAPAAADPTRKVHGIRIVRGVHR